MSCYSCLKSYIKFTCILTIILGVLTAAFGIYGASRNSVTNNNVDSSSIKEVHRVGITILIIGLAMIILGLIGHCKKIILFFIFYIF